MAEEEPTWSQKAEAIEAAFRSLPIAPPPEKGEAIPATFVIPGIARELREREFGNRVAKTRNCPSLWFRMDAKSPKIAGFSAPSAGFFWRDETGWLGD